MDRAAILRDIYRCYREKRLAEAVAVLSDDFQFKSDQPDDPIDPLRPRSRAELTLMVHKFFEDFDILNFEPFLIVVDDQDLASAELNVSFRHRKSGKVIETRLLHDWRFTDGKVSELHQHHDTESWQTFLRSVAEAS
jgi:ketosteroid isomerase-like protein